MNATIALAGNPNSGKTTLFNELTGARQHVGNYPGVTVEKKEGTYKQDDISLKIVDLPGTYSLTAYSLEEVVARDFLVQEKPETVIDIVDASNLERNLYLMLQFMELGIPVCMALNMIDVSEKRGIEIDTKKLSELLGIPVVPTIARTGKGKQELMKAAADLVGSNTKPLPLEISYGDDIDNALAEMEVMITDAMFLTQTYPARWTALKYLENDEQIRSIGDAKNPGLSAKLKKITDRVSSHISNTLNTYPEAVIADHRYGYIRSIIRQDVITYQQDQDRLRISDKIDRIVTNRFAGPLLMIAIIFGLYQFTFTYSETPVGWLESFFGWVGGIAETNLPDGLVKSLIISGIIDGVGGVLGFVPLIMFMFLGISLLEDSGYLARVAFMLDRVFRIFGLHGSSVMAFIVSGGIAGGCAVPGVMATRTLKSPKERLATLLTVPFMNCGAKLPVFVLLIAAFFAENKAMMMFIITLIAWGGALLAAKFLRMTVIKGASTPFIMELPPYHLPTFKGLAIHTWERTWQYIKKAGTVILGISIILWAMMTFPGLPETQTQIFEQQRQTLLSAAPSAVVAEIEAPDGKKDDETEISEPAQQLNDKLLAVDRVEAETALKHSIAGRFGTALEGLTQFAGFDWRTNIALVGGFAAKEVVVSTLGTAYSLGEVDPEEIGSLSDVLANDPGWNPLVAFSLIIFTIFYAPCFVAVVCIAREAGSWKWGAFSMVFNTVIAFILSITVYQIGSIIL
ncbi:MAG: ferrous iron transport protein B [Desulfobacteraceae bacterium]|nr:ferrous iron transport protein B [Desulfobacteraceae bacterium]MBC2755429.1 ferrous iron transport protein B [Desulfobacteraceae bacterium]